MIFISYAHKYKKASVDRLYEFLTEKGYEIWKDDKGGMKGDKLKSIYGTFRLVIYVFSDWWNFL